MRKENISLNQPRNRSIRQAGESVKNLLRPPEIGRNPAEKATVSSDVNSSDRLQTRMTMKKKAPRQPVFGSDHLPLQIDDLPGVEPTKLNRHFSRRRRSRVVDLSDEIEDPVRSRAVEGLGLIRGRRFFET